MTESTVSKPRESIDPSVVRADLAMEEPSTIQADAEHDPELAAKADEFIGALLQGKEDPKQRERSKASVEMIGVELQKKAAAQSDKLKDPVHKLSRRGDDGGEVANALLDLRVQVESLDPARFDFEAGWMTRMLGYIPGIGTPMKRYFSKYESAQTVINAIIKSLELGREQLKRDNITLSDDQARMRDLSGKLMKTIKLSQIIDQKLQAKLDNELVAGTEEYTFVAEELLFPIRQRTMDLQQQLAVAQQGTIALEIIIRNNRELIRGVNRALQVTISALQVAVTVALALADQKIVLEKVQALSATTSDMIASTAARLKTQGTEIHKAASQTKLDMDALRSAFTDIREALEDISQFRMSALPQMAAQVKELDRLTGEVEEVIQRKEKSNIVDPIIPIELE